jgi:hypothetical protein
MLTDMSALLQNEINAAYEWYYSTATESELAEEASWADFATEQFAAIYCDEAPFDHAPRSGAARFYYDEDSK